MRLLNVINEGGQWIAIGAFLVFLFSFNIDFFESAPKRVTDLESRQAQHESRVKSLEERLSRLESKVGGLTSGKNVVVLQEQIDSLRTDLENLTSSDTSPLLGQSETIPAETVAKDKAEASQALPWYKKKYVWMSGTVVLILLILLGWSGKKRKRKASLSMIRGRKNNQPSSSIRDCA